MDNNNQNDGLQMNNTPYGNPQTNNVPYGNPQTNNAPYGNPQMGNVPYGNPQMGNAPYGNPQMGNMQYGGMQMGNPQNGNAPKKNGTGIVLLCILLGIALMTGIVVAIIRGSKNEKDDSTPKIDHSVSDNGANTTDVLADPDTTEATEAEDDTENTEAIDDTEEVDSSDSTDEEDASEDTGNKNTGDYDKEGYVKILDEYFECYSNHDMAGMGSYYPEGVGDQIWDSTMAMVGVDTEDGYWQFMELAYGKDFTVTYEIKSTSTVQRVEYSMLEASITTAYGISVDFDYAIKVKLDETCVGDLNTATVTESLLMAVIDGEWYVIGSIYY